MFHLFDDREPPTHVWRSSCNSCFLPDAQGLNAKAVGNKASASSGVSGRIGAVTDGSQNIRSAIQQSVRSSYRSKADSVREVSHMQNSPDFPPCSCRQAANACALTPFERGRLRLLMSACRRGM